MRASSWEKALLLTIKIGIWILPILPLYISGGMLFPFIAGKNFFFRIIVEIVFALWVSLAIIRPYYRPKLTPLFKAATIFITILFLADLFGPNPYRSFFSNYERMEGFMMLSHLYLYFVVLASVFKTKKDWLTFLHITLAVSLVVSFIGLMQRFGWRVSLQGGYRVDSTIGNPAYLASYLSFHIWLLLILIKQYWHKQGLRVFYLSAFFFELVIIYLTATRGAILALLVGAILLLASTVIWWGKMFPSFPGLRKWAAILLAFIVLMPMGVWLLRDTPFVRSQQILNRMTSISLSDKTTQARFLIWNMSLKGVLERPVLGWGQENYYLVFQKYYNPALYGQEQWFDRSHNIFFDWAIHAGILGLLSFLGIVAAVLWRIIRALRASQLPAWEGVILVLVFVGHFFQDLFVFDNLNTYLLFFGFLAYSQFRTDGETVEKPVPPNRTNASRAYPAVAVLLAIVVVAGYYLHWKPMAASRNLVRALAAYQSNRPLSEIQALFARALSYHTFGNTEIREQMSNIARDVLIDTRGTEEERAQFIPFVAEELRKETASSAKDIKHMVFLASILGRAKSINPAYPAEAEQILKEAISLSPGKQMLYFELAQLYLSHNLTDQSIETLRQALRLDPTYPRAILNLAFMGYTAKRPEIVAEAEPYFGYIKLGALNEDEIRILARLHSDSGNLAAARDTYFYLIEINPSNPHYRAIVAAFLAELGEFDRAIEEAEVAGRLDPGFAREAEVFINQVKAKQAATK